MDDLEKIQAQIAELMRKEAEIKLKNKQAVLDELKAKIKSYGITLKDLGLSDKPVDKQKSSVAVKYHHGGNTWTGRGRQPKWVVDYIATGGKIEDLLV